MSLCFLGLFFVTAITSVEGTCHCVFFFFFGRRLFWPGKAPAIDCLCRCHCHLQCFDTQLDPISVWFFLPVVCTYRTWQLF